MRLASLVLLMFLFPACAIRPDEKPVAAELEQPRWEEWDDAPAQPAAALAFDPLPSVDEPPLDFPRDPRAQGAYWGIKGPQEVFFYQRVDDRYGSGWDYDSFGDHYRRRTVETKVGTSVR